MLFVMKDPGEEMEESIHVNILKDYVTLISYFYENHGVLWI
jgi:hypothetical protein